MTKDSNLRSDANDANGGVALPYSGEEQAFGGEERNGDDDLHPVQAAVRTMAGLSVPDADADVGTSNGNGNTTGDSTMGDGRSPPTQESSDVTASADGVAGIATAFAGTSANIGEFHTISPTCAITATATSHADISSHITNHNDEIGHAASSNLRRNAAPAANLETVRSVALSNDENTQTGSDCLESALPARTGETRLANSCSTKPSTKFGRRFQRKRAAAKTDGNLDGAKAVLTPMRVQTIAAGSMQQMPLKADAKADEVSDMSDTADGKWNRQVSTMLDRLEQGECQTRSGDSSLDMADTRIGLPNEERPEHQHRQQATQQARTTMHGAVHVMPSTMSVAPAVPSSPAVPPLSLPTPSAPTDGNAGLQPPPRPVVAELARVQEDLDVLVNEQLQREYDEHMEKDLRERIIAQHGIADAEPVSEVAVIETQLETEAKRKRQCIILSVALCVIVATIAIAVGVLVPQTSTGTKTLRITNSPTMWPSLAPSISVSPSLSPSTSTSPSVTPTNSLVPSVSPSESMAPSTAPTLSTAPSTLPSALPSVQPSNVPSMSASPTIDPLFLQYIDILAPILQAEPSLTNRSVFEDPTSPESQAIRWLAENHEISGSDQQTFSNARSQTLAHHDNGDVTSPRNESALNIDASDLNQLLEKYVLVLLYFKMNNKRWASLYDYLEPHLHHCQWHKPGESSGIFCNEDFEVITISLGDHFISGTIPDELYFLTNLQIMDFGSCTYIDGTISTHIGRLTNLLEVGLELTTMHGEFPSEIGLLTGLKSWQSYYSYFSGSLPTEIGNMTSLEYLDVTETVMTGSLPTELGNLVNLEYAYMYDNSFAGLLPTEIGSMESLEVFYVENCQFHGHIPSEVGQLANLRKLYLHGNKHLNGTLPSEISNLSNLEELSIGGTSIVGNLDPILCLADNMPDYIWADCASPPGDSVLSQVTCSCCSECCYTDDHSGDVECEEKSNPAHTMCYNNECTSCGNERFVSSCAGCIDRNISSLGIPPKWIDFDALTSMELCSGSCVLEETSGMCKTRNFTASHLG